MSSSRRLLSQMTRRSATQSSMLKTSVGKPLSYTFILGFITRFSYPRSLPTGVLLIRFRHLVHIKFSWTKIQIICCDTTRVYRTTTSRKVSILRICTHHPSRVPVKIRQRQLWQHPKHTPNHATYSLVRRSSKIAKQGWTYIWDSRKATTDRSWTRLTYSLVLGPRVSADLACHASKAKPIMKSAGVGSFPPENHSLSSLDKWASI